MNSLTLFPAMPPRPPHDQQSTPPTTPQPSPATPGTPDPAPNRAATTGTPAARWPGARWIGSLNLRDLDEGTQVALTGSADFRRARLLIRDGASVRGYVDVAIRDTHLDRGELDRQLALLPHPDDTDPLAEPASAGIGRASLPSVTVVVCTRDRATLLRDALRSILASDHPDFTVIVVDNAPATTATRDLVRQEFHDPRLRLIGEPEPGLSRARNTGLRHATGTIVAFTDDDVVVDAGWLRQIAATFAGDAEVACVSGPVPTGELTTPVHAYFDARVSWSRNLRLRRFSMARPPRDLPLFPFSPAAFGTGANFALRRSAALALGGFDPALGVGTRTGGGEDIDMFTRVILAGHTLVLQPAAIVWHRHRGDLAALEAQARGYGTGLGAWLSKVARDPATARRALALAPRAAAQLLRLGQTTPRAAGRSVPRGRHGQTADGEGTAAARRVSPAAGLESTLGRELGRVRRVELRSLLRGPFLYAAERRSAGARRAAPSLRQALGAAEAGLRRPESRPGLACVVLAHTDPVQVRRLVDALDPFPVFLHVDVRTPDPVYQAMTRHLPERCVPLTRVRTGWARWENVAAEIEGYRAALAVSDASHIGLLSGTDYPLAGADEIRELFARNLGRSFAHIDTLPHPRWGQDHGFARLRYRHWVVGKHMLRLPIPRHLPAGVVFAGGSQMKILCREDAQAIVAAYDENPGLGRFWRRSWIPDETFIPSLLCTPRFVPGWATSHVPASLWWIDWGDTQRKSPSWLGPGDAGRVLSRRLYAGQPIPSLMARKFSTAASTALLDTIDRELLGRRHDSLAQKEMA